MVPALRRLVCVWMACCAGAWLASVPVRSQTPIPQRVPVESEYDFYTRGPYAGRVPRPSEVLGYEPGAYYANYGAVERLLTKYAAASDRLRLVRMGQTPELRPMYLAIVSSPANLARLEEIRANNHRLADPRVALTPDDVDALVAQQPVIVWLSYNIHGDEAAGTEAALQVLYQLLDSDDPAWRDVLERVVVVLNPCQNPDGRERFVTWYNAHGIGRPETFAWEKENPWNVQGRLNHYYFDLNRDLVVTSQLESQHAARAFLEWLPHVLADHHGETKEYFFPPAAQPINPNLPRTTFEQWLDRFGRGNAAAFDAHGWLFYVRDVFDVFYPGYWDSWPSLQGAIGMTYETSGGGKRGRNYRRDDDTIMTLRSAIAKHFEASLATLRTAAEHRAERLRDFRQHFVSAYEQGRVAPLQQVFLPPGRDPQRTRELVAVLQRAGVEVHRLEQAQTVTATRNYFGSLPQDRTLPAGTFVVDLQQARGRVARALLEPDTPQDADFVARQEEKRTRNRLRGENVPDDHYEFYDLTAWSLPLLFGVDAYWTDQPLAGLGPLVGAGSAPAPAAPARGRTAYVFAPDNEASLRLALRLLGEGYRLATSVRPLEAGERSFIRGTLIARVERNPESLHRRIQELATELGAEVHPVDTAFTSAGITGIGSETTYSLQPPKVAVLAGRPTTPTSYGALRFLFERTYGVDYVPMSAEALRQVRLADFNVLVLPSGRPAGFGDVFDAELLGKLEQWVRAGGTLIALGGATEFLVQAEGPWSGASRVGAGSENGRDDEGTAAETKREQPRTAEEETDPLPVPGAVVRAMVNQDHFLTFGYEEAEVPYLVATDTFFRPTTTGTNVVTFAEENLRLAGFLWPGNTERLLGGTAAVMDEPLGEGRLVLFSDEPGARQLWHGSTRLLINALLYSPGLRHEGATYFAE